MNPNIQQIALKREIASLTPAEELTLIAEIRQAYLASQAASSDPLNTKIIAEAAHASIPEGAFENLPSHTSHEGIP